MDQPLNPRTTLFVGGVPRLLKAQELGEIMNTAFGHVSYAGIDVDPWMKYPKGTYVCTYSQAWANIVHMYYQQYTLNAHDISHFFIYQTLLYLPGFQYRNSYVSA